MSFVGTLAKVAAGYALARGVDHLSSEPGTAFDTSDLAETTGLDSLFGGFSDGAQGDGSGDLLGLAGIVGALGLAGGAVAATTGLGDVLSGSIHDNAPTPAQEEAAKLQLRAMIQAAKSDGALDMREKQKILDTVRDASPGEVAFVNAQFSAPLDPRALAADTPDGLEETVYRTALMTARPSVPAEAAFLEDLGAALGLTEARMDVLRRKSAQSV